MRCRPGSTQFARRCSQRQMPSTHAPAPPLHVFNCTQVTKATAALSSHQPLERLKVAPQHRMCTRFANRIYLILFKRALASVAAETRAMNARVGLSARLLQDEKARNLAAGGPDRACDASDEDAL
jgi:hypothetical protein